jgi:MFS transporter, DHA1 family, tetracycline resistance protein
MTRQVPKNRLMPIFFITLFNEIAITIGFPVLTFLCFDPNSTLFASSATTALRSFWFGVLSALPNIIAIVAYPILGYFSDRFGRKPILIIGIISALLLCTLTALGIFYSLVILLLIGSIIAGFCSRTMPIALAVVGDISEKQHKIINMGYFQFFVSIGAFIGPLLGGFFARRFFFKELNFSIPYLIGMVVAIFTVIFTVKYFTESYRYRSVNYEKIFWKRLFSSKVILISIVLALTQISWRIYYLFVSPVLQMHFHYSATNVGLFLGLIALWLALASAFGVRWLNNHITIWKIIKYSCYAELLGLFMFILGSMFSLGVFSQYLIWSSAVPVAMSDVIIFCALTALYSQAVSEHDQGKIMGLCFVITAIVSSFSSFIGGFLMQINLNLPILCAPLGLIILLFIPMKTKL